MSTDALFDPFQVFEVTYKKCAAVHVRVIRGRKITKGWAKDLMDIPDPYVILTLANSPSPWRKTTVKDNDVNPEWNETFTFWVDPDQEHTLEMSLMDANYTMDEHLASRSLSLNPLPLERKISTTIGFNETSEVDIEVWAEIKDKSDLRFSLTLCKEEKNFIEARKRKILKAMKNHYGFASPRNYKEVPVIGIMGSGGGFRAMVAYSGAMSALSELGVLDMATYVGGLSGSAWYLSQLYSHPQWPNISLREQREEIKYNIDHSFLWLFKSHGFSFAKEVWKKRSRGEPVSFTDLFGHLVGNTLLKNRLDAKLSQQCQVISDGQCPMPFYTCLHVKKSVSAMIFHEWMEFSPYEVGLPKYGTFLKTEQFSCKFFMGSMVKHYPEPPLHFLQGIWGSAFCIQFKRLLQEDKHATTMELMKREREEFVEELKKDMEVCDVADSESSDDENVNEKGTHGEKTTGGLERRRSKSTKLKQKSFWDSMLSRMFESKWFQSIELRAAQVYNFMRGLKLNDVFPFSPFTKTQEEEDENNKDTFGSIFDLHPTNVKKLYVVDSGLTFNSPYPVLLRPQREVDLILSFDFSARPTDDTPPFKELLLAAKWAELNKVPFPPIDPSVFKTQGLKECYVFKHPWDPNCPIVLHFCLANLNFRRETSPGVPRTTQEELDFGNFSIFDDPARPYSTFKFTYTHLEFDRLSKLMEYNTLLCKDEIFNNISICIKRRRRFSIRRPCTKKDIARLSLKSKVKADKLAEYITMVEKVSELAEKEEKEQSSKSAVSILLHRDGSKPDVMHRESSGAKERPASSPVKFMEEENQNEYDNEIKNVKLQRSTVSLKGNLGRGRRRLMSSGMSQVVEEEADEQEEEEETPVPEISNSGSPQANSDPSHRAANPKVVLSRSRLVSASMKPGLSVDRYANRSQQTVTPEMVQGTLNIIDNNNDTHSCSLSPNVNGAEKPQPVLSPRLKKKLLPQQEIQDQVASSSSVCSTPNTSEINCDTNKSQSSIVNRREVPENERTKDKVVADIPVNSTLLEEWIDAEEHVTAL